MGEELHLLDFTKVADGIVVHRWRMDVEKIEAGPVFLTNPQCYTLLVSIDSTKKPVNVPAVRERTSKKPEN